MARDRPPSSEDGEQPRIKVTDRRLFDRQGNLRRPDAETSPSAPAVSGGQGGTADQSRPAAKSGPEATRDTAPTGEVGTADTPTEQTAAGDDTVADRGADEVPDSERRILSPGGPSADELPRDFSAFVESHYFETMLYLGAARHPQSGQLMEDIPLAKYKIDLLEMLKEKTTGNLTPEEDRLLEDVLYQLRTAYLQKTKAARL